MRVLFLDDNLFRCFAARHTFVGHDLHIVHTAQDTIRLLGDSSGSFEFVTLDHDLNSEFFVDSSRQDCGMEVVRWIVENKPSIGTINVHSWNHKAADEMVESLHTSGCQVVRRLFGDKGFVDEGGL